MMVTPLPLPPGFRSLLRSCAKPICDRLSQMTVADASEFCVELSTTPSACLWVTVTRNGTKKIEALSARLVPHMEYLSKRYTEPPTDKGFWCTVPAMGGAVSCSRDIAMELFKLLIGEEVEKRYRIGPRELVVLTDDDLLALNKAVKTRPVYSSDTGGAKLSEDFLAALVARELAVRDTESAHARLECQQVQSRSLAAAAKALERERARASRIRPHWMPSTGIRADLSEDDRALLIARDQELAMFWRRFKR